MTRGSPSETCGDHGGRRQDGEPCGRAAGWGTDFDSGKCRECRGTNPDGTVAEGHGAPEGNGNALKHGSTADPTNLYEHLTSEQQEWVDRRVEAYVDQAPHLSMDDPEVGRVEIAVVMMFQERAARGELIKEEMKHERTVGVSEDGRPITTTEAHYLNPVASSLNTDIRMTLKDHGLLDDPESQKADATQDLADAWQSELERGSTE